MIDIKMTKARLKRLMDNFFIYKYQASNVNNRIY